MVRRACLDAEQGTYAAPRHGGSEDMSGLPKSSVSQRESNDRNIAGAWGYIFQIIFQVIIFF